MRRSINQLRLALLFMMSFVVIAVAPIQALAADNTTTTTGADSTATQTTNPLDQQQTQAAEKNWRLEGERAPFDDYTDLPCGATNITTAINTSLPADFPEPAKTIFTNAANAAQTSPSVLAAIYMNEHAIDDYKTIPTDRTKLDGGASNTDTGAAGPFQILPKYWKSEWGDINNFEAAANAAAKAWLRDIGKVGPNPELGSVAEVKQGTVAFGLGTYVSGNPNYNPNDAYTKSYIESGLKRYQSLNSGSPSNNNANANSPSSNTQASGKIYVLGDSITVGLNSADLETKLKGIGFSEVKINAEGSRGILLPGTQNQKKTGLQAMQDDADYIKQASAVVILLGTNQDSNFADAQQKLLSEFNKLNPNAKYYWGNVFSVYTDSPDPGAAKTAAAKINKTITEKGASSTPKYSLLNGYKFVWGDDDATQIAQKSLPDPNKLLSSDGVHLTGDGYKKYADFLAQEIQRGGSAIVSNTPSTTCSKGSAAGSGQCIDEAKLPKINDAAKVADAINKFVEKNSRNDAPLRGLGDKFVSGAIRAQVNPFLEVSIAMQESGFGVAGVATQGINNAFGRTATDSEPHKFLGDRNWYQYDSWADSLDGGGTKDDQPTYMKRVYVDQGKITIKDFMLKYAPPSENDTEGYINGIKKRIQEMVTLSGDGVDCGGAGSLKDISYKDKAELVARVNKAVSDGKLILKPTHAGQTRDMIVNDINNTAQEPLLKTLVILAEQYGKPITIELIKENQGYCGDFDRNATNYGPYTSSHAYGLAVDFTAAGSSPDTVALFKTLYSNRSLLNIGELEHNPVPDGAKNMKFGEDYDYPAAIQNDHSDHIHLGIRGSGQTAPGCTPKPGGENV